MKKIDVYKRLAEAYGHPDSKFLPMILQTMVKEREAEILLALPASVKEIAEKLNREMFTINTILEKVYENGLVFYYFPSKKRKCYALINNFVDAILADKRINKKGKNFFKLWKQFSEEIDRVKVDDYSPGSRVLPIEKAIMRKDEILPYESVKEIIKGARERAIMECACRKRQQSCDTPLDTCMVFNNAAEYMLSRNAARKISVKEAIKVLNKCEEIGLVHETSSSAYGLEFICNCCPCCCYFLKRYFRYGSRKKSIRSRYRSKINRSLCINCGVCVKRCYFNALVMIKGKLVQRPKNCVGCGLCAAKCPANAVELIPVESPSFISKISGEHLFALKL